MAKDPWKDPDPQPGDYLEPVDPDDPDRVARHEGRSGAKLTQVVRVSGEDAARLDALAAKRGQKPDEVLGAGPRRPTAALRVFAAARLAREDALRLLPFGIGPAPIVFFLADRAPF
jgi:hypothetical protein